MPEVLFLIVFAITCGFLARNLIYSMIVNCEGLERKNYKNESIPVGAGLIIVFAALPVEAIISILSFGKNILWPLWISSTLLCCLLGLIDDVVGNRSDSGLKGHIKALFIERRLTTGGLKAAGGLLLAIYVALLNSDNIIYVCLNVIVISLSVNVINIFDLRPGRAGKTFYFFSFVLLLLAGFEVRIFFFIWPIMLATAIYMPFDLKAKAMMGDAGSNVLGVALGLTAAWFLRWETLFVYALLLILIHLIAEKNSFTKIIESNYLLKKIDEWGR